MLSFCRRRLCHRRRSIGAFFGRGLRIGLVRVFRRPRRLLLWPCFSALFFLFFLNFFLFLGKRMRFCFGGVGSRIRGFVWWRCLIFTPQIGGGNSPATTLSKIGLWLDNDHQIKRNSHETNHQPSTCLQIIKVINQVSK